MGQKGTPVQRLCGDSRYATAVAISALGWQSSDNVILTSGENFPDALAGTTLAGLKKSPVLLTGRDSLNQETLTEIQRLKAKNIYVLGGTGVISQAVEERLSQDYTVTRISGSGRYETAVKIGELINPANPVSAINTVILATGANYPDALSIAPFAGRYGLPILFTEKDGLNETTGQAIAQWGIKKVILVGGTGIISQETENLLRTERGLAVTRLSGEDRFLTGLEIIKYFADFQNSAGSISNSNNSSAPNNPNGSTAGYKQAALATGENFPDALAGAALAAQNKYPVFLVDRDKYTQAIKDYLHGLELEKLYVFGGQDAISDKVKEELSAKP